MAVEEAKDGLTEKKQNCEKKRAATAAAVAMMVVLMKGIWNLEELELLDPMKGRGLGTLTSVEIGEMRDAGDELKEAESEAALMGVKANAEALIGALKERKEMGLEMIGR